MSEQLDGRFPDPDGADPALPVGDPVTPRYLIRTLTGLAMWAGRSKESTAFFVYDRLDAWRLIDCFYGVRAKKDAQQLCAELNAEHETSL